MVPAIIMILAFSFLILARLLGIDNQYIGFVPLFIMGAGWLALPLIDSLWYRFKFPKAFSGKYTWAGKWASSKHRGFEGRLCINFPSDFTNDDEFTADALLYTSIKAPNNIGSFRKVRLTGLINGSDADGSATVTCVQDADTFEVTYNALLAKEFKQIAGGYKDPNDVGTFWVRKRPYTI